MNHGVVRRRHPGRNDKLGYGSVGGGSRQREAGDLTYLDGSPTRRDSQGAEGLLRVAVVSAGALAILVFASVVPSHVVYDAQIRAPEDGGRVRNGQQARVDQRGEGGAPAMARTEA